MRQGAIVLLTLVLLVTCVFSGCESAEELPDYVSRMSGHSVQIDVAKANGGAAHIDEETMNIVWGVSDFSWKSINQHPCLGQESGYSTDPYAFFQA